MQKPLHTMIIASGDLWAGAEAQVLSLAREVNSRADSRVSTIVFNDGELRARIMDAGIPCTCVDERTKSPLTMLMEIFALLRDSAPDVVHTNRPKEHVLGSIAARSLGIPSIRTVHGMAEHPPTGWDIKRRLWRTVDTLCARYLQQAVVLVSDDLARKSGSRFRQATLHTIANGIDVEEVRRRASRARDSTPRLEADTINIGFIGRLVSIKRVDLLVDLLDAMLALPNRRRYVLHVVGDGPLRGALEARGKGAIHERRLVMHGFQQDPAGYLAQFRALVFTSDYEGLSIAALESLALGVPVVSRPVGGMRDLAREGADVHIPSHDDTLALATLVDHIATRDQGASCPGLPARFTIGHCADEYLRIYRKVARTNSGTRS
jgi:glycosyltransferase involved in cell wall biosynthesis